MRVGQKNGLVYQWAKKGTRPRQPKDQRYENAYLFGAVCPGRNTGIAIIMPHADTEAMQKHVDEISLAAAPGAHALIIRDKAPWHTTRKLKLPENLTLVPLLPACPELNAVENIWQYLRQTYLSNRVFETYTAILDACQNAWRSLLNELGRIESIASRDWASTGLINPKSSIISQLMQVGRVAFLKSAVLEARLPGALVSGFDEIRCDIDAQDVGSEPCRRQCSRSVAASKIKHFESLGDSEALDESFSTVAHACRNAGKVAFFPQGFIGIHWKPPSLTGLFRSLGFASLTLRGVARCACRHLSRVLFWRERHRAS